VFRAVGVTIPTGIEKTGEQCTVVFAFIVTESARDFVCVKGEGGRYTISRPLAGSVTIYVKTTVYCSPDSSMLTGKC
jgi:hypothetical protein